MARAKAIPDTKQEIKDVPETTATEAAPIPGTEVETRELPAVGTPENTVIIGGKLIEIKPTKLLYQRNRTAVFYHILEMYPLPDILAMDGKSFGDGLDGDKKLCDWLIAVTDDEELIRENYDSIDSGTIYRMLEIYKRVNKIAELEEKLKNAKTPREG